MQNYSNDNSARRYIAHVSQVGITQFQQRNPYIIAWWSAAFPGFGHMLLSKYLRGFLLFFWEMVININAHLNEAIVYTFMGEFEKTTSVLDTRWVAFYLPVYFFAIWDSYRTTIDINSIALLAERENHSFNSFSIGALEINYLDKRKPIMAFIWSIFTPGLGQFYSCRIISAAFILVWVVVIGYYSHFLEGLHLIILGEITEATEIFDKQWLLFFPSIFGFSMYDSYVSTVESNKLYIREQQSYFKKSYQNPEFIVKFNRRS